MTWINFPKSESFLTWHVVLDSNVTQYEMKCENQEIREKENNIEKKKNYNTVTFTLKRKLIVVVFCLKYESAQLKTWHLFFALLCYYSNHLNHLSIKNIWLLAKVASVPVFQKK